MRLEVESRLTNSEKFSNTSDAAWLLFVGPIDVPMVVGFLDGIQAPRVEFFDLQHRVEVLAESWRVYHDFGAALDDHRAAVRSDGQ